MLQKSGGDVSWMCGHSEEYSHRCKFNPKRGVVVLLKMSGEFKGVSFFVLLDSGVDAYIFIKNKRNDFRIFC